MGRALFLSLAVCGAFASGAHADSYAFLVGVQDYDVKELDRLAYTRADITAFQKVLLTTGFPAENVVMLHDDPQATPDPRFIATAARIREELKLLLDSVEADDVLVIALAGHGVQFKGDADCYFCPLDARLKDRNTLISLKELYERLRTCPARRKLMLVDACRNDPASNVSRSAGVPAVESVTQPQLTPAPEGVVALFSCAEGQQAYEDPALRHGVFFHHVLEGWEGAADDGDQRLTLDELIAYTKSKTKTHARVKLAAVQSPRQLGYVDGEWLLHNVGARPAERPVTLELLHAPGQVLRTENTQDTTTEAVVEGKTVVTRIVQTMHAETHVESVASDGTASLRMKLSRIEYTMRTPDQSFKYDSAARANPNPPPGGVADVLGAMVGHEFPIVMEPTGRIRKAEVPQALIDTLQRHPDAVPGYDFRGNLEKTLSQSSFLLPGRPVRKGDTWTDQREVPLGFATVRAKTTYTYLGVNPSGKHEIDLKITGSMTSDPQQSIRCEMSNVQSQGTLYFDPQLGQMTSGKAEQSFLMKLSAGEESLDQRVEQVIRMVMVQ